MEELTEALATSFSVSQELNTTAAEHPRFSQYKLKLSPSQRQDVRRKKILDVQKKDRDDRVSTELFNANLIQDNRPALPQIITGRRFDFANHARNLTEGTFEGVSNEAATGEGENMGGEEEQMEVQTSMRRPGRYYKDQLMYSEWLVEVPDDFDKEWLMVVCPEGKRRLVVSARGQTTAYSKGGYKCNTFPSQLPGGNRSQLGRRQYGESAILDCVYNEKTKTFYILDMMYWKNMPIYDSETEFRFYWLHEKIQECPSVSVVRKANPFKFIPLPSFPCTAVTISNAITCATFDIDGLLFYHKRTHYTFGPTPLVVWLKTYMVPDVLNVSVPYKEVAKAPPSYTNYSNHLVSVKDQVYGSTPERERKPRGKGRSERKMDESIEETNSANSSFEASAGGDATPTKGIIQMPKAFNFGASQTSPFKTDDKKLVGPISQQPVPSAGEGDCVKKGEIELVAESMDDSGLADEGKESSTKGESPTKESGGKKKKNRKRGKKGKNQMDTQ